MPIDVLTIFGLLGVFLFGFFAIALLRRHAAVLTFVLGAVAMLLVVEVLLAAEARAHTLPEMDAPAEAIAIF